MRCVQGHWHGKPVKRYHLSPANHRLISSRSLSSLLLCCPQPIQHFTAGALPLKYRSSCVPPAQGLDSSPLPTLVIVASQAPPDLPAHPPPAFAAFSATLPLALGKATDLEQ